MAPSMSPSPFLFQSPSNLPYSPSRLNYGVTAPAPRSRFACNTLSRSAGSIHAPALINGGVYQQTQPPCGYSPSPVLGMQSVQSSVQLPIKPTSAPLMSPKAMRGSHGSPSFRNKVSCSSSTGQAGCSSPSAQAPMASYFERDVCRQTSNTPLGNSPLSTTALFAKTHSYTPAVIGTQQLWTPPEGTHSVGRPKSISPVGTGVLGFCSGTGSLSLINNNPPPTPCRQPPQSSPSIQSQKFRVAAPSPTRIVRLGSPVYTRSSDSLIASARGTGNYSNGNLAGRGPDCGSRLSGRNEVTNTTGRRYDISPHRSVVTRSYSPKLRSPVANLQVNGVINADKGGSSARYDSKDVSGSSVKHKSPAINERRGSDVTYSCNTLAPGEGIIGTISERPNPFLSLLPAETREKVETISKLLNERGILKTHVVHAFKKVAPPPPEPDGFDDVSDDETTNGPNKRPDTDLEQELDVPSLHRFRDALAADLSLPAEAFVTDLDTEVLRFDFSGSGNLRLNEVYKMVKFHLREYRKELGGAPITADIPFKSVEAAGYVITQKLGAGNQGTAYLAKNIHGNRYCIKCYIKERMNASSIEDLKDEFEALKLLHCDSIAGAFEMFQDAHHFCMVGDAFYGGDLMTLRQRATAQNVNMNETWWSDVFKQIFEALAFMHKQAMIHCDIKEPNIMVKTEDFHVPQVVVIDLGVARAMASKNEGIPHGTPGYVPPETWETKKWFPSGDIFSCGVVIVQLILDKLPEDKMDPDGGTCRGGLFVEGCKTIREIYEATMKKEPPLHLMPHDMPNIRELAEGCLQKKMIDRIHTDSALRLPMFARSSKVHLDGDKNRRGSLPLSLNPRNKFASVGITASFLDAMDDSLEESEKERRFLEKQKKTREKTQAFFEAPDEKDEESEDDNFIVHSSSGGELGATDSYSPKNALPGREAREPVRTWTIEEIESWFRVTVLTAREHLDNNVYHAHLRESWRQANQHVPEAQRAELKKMIEEESGLALQDLFA